MVSFYTLKIIVKSSLHKCQYSMELWTKCYPTITYSSVLSLAAGVLKLFHVKDPQIDTYQPADPHLKRYATGTPIREDFSALAVILNHFNF